MIMTKYGYDHLQRKGRNGVSEPNNLHDVDVDVEEEPDVMLLDSFVIDHESLTGKVFVHHPELFVKHRLSTATWDKNFWDRLYCSTHKGWLETHHILLWSRVLMHARPGDARWAIIGSVSMESSEDMSAWAGYVSGNEGSEAWWNIDKVWIPIVVDRGHWLLGELVIRKWELTIFDSAVVCGYFQKFKDSGKFEHFSGQIVKLLDTTNYWSHAKVNRRTDMLECLEAVDVPQQRSNYGDCGVYVCMFMERLASGLAITCLVDGDADDISRQLRVRMGNIFWNTR